MQTIQTLPLSAIDTADSRFKISRADQDVSALARSIDKIGLCTPLRVLETTGSNDPGARDNSYILVSGFRRFEALNALGRSAAACEIILQDQKQTCAALAVADNAFQRELAPGELIRAIALVSDQMDAQQIADASQVIFNTPLNRGHVNSLLKISQQSQDFLTLLDSGQLSIKAAKALGALESSDVCALVSLIGQVKVSSGKQMEIITWAREIAAREGIGLEALCTDKELVSVMAANSHHSDLGAAGNRLRGYLFQRRFPELEAARKKALAQVHALKLEKGVRLNLPDNFESRVYTLSIDFTSPKDLEMRLKTLSELVDTPMFKSIWDR